LGGRSKREQCSKRAAQSAIVPPFPPLTLPSPPSCSKHGRFPTFWLDKCCVDQKNIGDSLKVLPVFVMASKKMLVLAGPSYPTRLWCVWELFTLFAFSLFEVALDRVELVAFADDETAGASRKVMMDMEAFKGQLAACYDPNEERKLKTVIRTIGDAIFDERVQQLSRSVSEKVANKTYDNTTW